MERLLLLSLLKVVVTVDGVDNMVMAGAYAIDARGCCAHLRTVDPLTLRHGSL